MTPRSRIRLARSLGAFTLLEILVATTITLLLVVLLASMIQGTLGIYGRMTGDPENSAESRIAIKQIVADLQALGLSNRAKGEILRITPESSAPGKLNANSTVWLTFLASATDVDDSSSPVEGALRAISYRVAHQNPVDASTKKPVYSLHRSIASAAHTFAHAIGLDNLQTNYWRNVPPAPAPTPLPPTDIQTYLAGDVVGFQVRFEYTGTGGNSTWTKLGDSVRITDTGSEVNGALIPGGFRSAEVTLTVLSDRGRMLVEDNILGIDEAIRRYGRTEVARVALPQIPGEN